VDELRAAEEIQLGSRGELNNIASGSMKTITLSANVNIRR
jgi:hypothetical protein